MWPSPLQIYDILYHLGTGIVNISSRCGVMLIHLLQQSCVEMECYFVRLFQESFSVKCHSVVASGSGSVVNLQHRAEHKSTALLSETHLISI